MRRRKFGEPRVLSAQILRVRDSEWMLYWTEDDGTDRTDRPVREQLLEAKGRRAVNQAQREAARLLGISIRSIGIGG